MVRDDRLGVRRVVILIPVVLIAIGASSHAEGPAPEPSRLPSPGTWPRLQLPDPVGSNVARKALDLAWERLARIDCADVLNTFMDRAGRPLDERLRELAVDRQTYLTMVVFIDGSRDADQPRYRRRTNHYFGRGRRISSDRPRPWSI